MKNECENILTSGHTPQRLETHPYILETKHEHNIEVTFFHFPREEDLQQALEDYPDRGWKDVKKFTFSD